MGRRESKILNKADKLKASAAFEDIPVEEKTHLETHPDLDVEKYLSVLRYPPPLDQFSTCIVSPILNPWLGIFIYCSISCRCWTAEC
jgi:hypothetical protein